MMNNVHEQLCFRQKKFHLCAIFVIQLVTSLKLLTQVSFKILFYEDTHNLPRERKKPSFVKVEWNEKLMKNKYYKEINYVMNIRILSKNKYTGE